jgi:small nuclear ribonucleoprotein (snRNP)-like protein
MSTSALPALSSPESQQIATDYLSSFLNKQLRVQIQDGRMFVGSLKCTDRERNLILAVTHEYREPTENDRRIAAERHEALGLSGTVKVDMRKRFVGLIVVPGQYITKIEIED